jgi:murein DD-endopeptidase MepM/ murein hydrolase activator NlpD
VVSHDAELLSALRQAQQEVAWQRHLLVQKQGELAQAHRENADWVQRVQAQAEAREKLLRAVQHEAALQEQQLRELEEDSQDVQNALERELARRLAHPQSFRALPSWSGHFFMPAHGRVTSGFGYRYHPVLHYTRLHSGIDIGVGVGSPVYAAADGEVFFASVRGGYGRCIIVLHGGNISTLYGHLSRIDVRPGQSVRRGQMIGASGNSGLSTGPHLHFEVRRNGVPVNPL